MLVLCVTFHSWLMSSCGLLLRRQSTSSVSFPMLQPTSLPNIVARLRASAGVTDAQGELGTPLWRMALVKVCRLPGDNRWNPTEAAPALSPNIVTYVRKSKLFKISLFFFKIIEKQINQPAWGFHQRNEYCLEPTAALAAGPGDPCFLVPQWNHARQENQKHRCGSSRKPQWATRYELGNGHRTHPMMKNHCKTLQKWHRVIRYSVHSQTSHFIPSQSVNLSHICTCLYICVANCIMLESTF